MNLFEFCWFLSIYIYICPIHFLPPGGTPQELIGEGSKDWSSGGRCSLFSRCEGTNMRDEKGFSKLEVWNGSAKTRRGTLKIYSRASAT